MLFIIFMIEVNDLFKFYKCLLFTDDLKLYAQVNTPDDCLVNEDYITILKYWLVFNFVKLNVYKLYFLVKNNH